VVARNPLFLFGGREMTNPIILLGNALIETLERLLAGNLSEDDEIRYKTLAELTKLIVEKEAEYFPPQNPRRVIYSSLVKAGRTHPPSS
jgi:hypothetical protein